MIAPVTFSPPLEAVHLGSDQPNELDLRRIMRILQKRERYRYVTVNIVPTKRGYRILSPCCSRNLAPEGHLIDIALFEYDDASTIWHLFSKDHFENIWRRHRHSETLVPLVEYLIADPEKIFWQ